MYWVCVSDPFDLKSILRKIISSEDQNQLTLQLLQDKVRQQIEGKRYLLVLDDVWNEDRIKWDELSRFLKLGAKGSKVLVTTRSKKIAQIVGSTETHVLCGLDEHKSWDLFEREVFGTRKYEASGGLVEIGKGIVEKCGGVPLAIKAIGGLLLSKKDSSQNHEREWIRFRDTELAQVDDQKDSGILPTLKLSYNNLPSHLKHCFAYSSLFPKDHRINVRRLIQLWMAQGFIIEPERNTRQLEEIGYDYFFVLFSGCFFQEAETNELSGVVEHCKMHDLMHDLASLVAGKSIKRLEGNVVLDNDFEKARHIYFDFPYNSSCQIPRPLSEQERVRSFISTKYLSSSDYDNILSNFKFLRALNLDIIDTWPNTLGKLKHLRYLDLSRNRCINELPNSITALYNLETLILSSCTNLKRLPRDIQNLINLRHLETDDCWELTHMPHAIGALTSLQTLNMFAVADDNQSSESQRAGFGELSKLNNLHGHLNIKIMGLGKKDTYELGAAHCLKDKKFLESLDLTWRIVQEEETMENAYKEAIERLEPPQKIKSIQVWYYPGDTIPSWLSLLTNLVQLRLYGCGKCKYLPPLHHLSSFKELRIEKLSALEYVSELGDNDEWNRGDHSSKSFFPSLITLLIKGCNNLKGWWRGSEREEALLTQQYHQQAFFPKLADLVIIDCHALTSLPPCLNLEKLFLCSTTSKLVQQMITMKLKSDGVATSLSSSPSSSSSSSLSALSNLKDLSIQSVNDLESLPEEIGNHKSLQQLYITYCRNLTSLPETMNNLKSLQMLVISVCPNLTSLPEGIGSLPCLEQVNDKKCTEIPMETLADYLVQENRKYSSNENTCTIT